MLEIEQVTQFIQAELGSITQRPADEFAPETALIGAERAIKSTELIELLLALEDYVENNTGKEFDWAADADEAENGQGMLSTIGTLANSVVKQVA